MSELPPLTWDTFFGTWSLQGGWLLACAAALVGYFALRARAGAASTVPAWRVACFTAGVVLLWVCVASAIGAYAMSLFWMHMVLHLLLIMVVPALLVLGHPITVTVESLREPRQEHARRVLKSPAVGVLTHPATGLLVYSATIFGTHLTGFMDQMSMNAWLMPAEQVLYVAAGYLLLLPLLGEEPIRSDPSYLTRMILLVVAMVPDTIVGLVLLQTDQNPFPMMTSMRPAWAPPALSDIHVAGGLMWAAGDGLMMAIGVGVMITAVTSASRRDRMIGPWLEGVRRSTLAGSTPAGSAAAPDPDSDEALEAYNARLARMHEREG